MMKIALATTYDVNHPEYWNKECTGNWGASIFISKSLQHQGVEIDFLGPVRENHWLFTRLKRAFYRYIRGENYYIWSDPLVCRDYANQIGKKLTQAKVDFVLCTEVFFIASYLETDLPIVLWIDSPLFALIGLYSYFMNLCEETPRDIFILEKQAVAKASLIIVTSDWAKSTIMSLYDVSSEKIHVIPRGANLEIVPSRSELEMKRLIGARDREVCHLLFSSTDWQRKGGDIAVAVVVRLNELGFACDLTVIGCQPKMKQPYPSFMRVEGYINKLDPAGKSKMIELISRSHFLILPTRADVNPLVLQESNALGLPCLVTGIMGINTVIKDGVNGQTFPFDAPIDDYCKFVMDHFRNYTEYENLAVASFGEYLSRLNWDVGSKRAVGLFHELLGVF